MNRNKRKSSCISSPKPAPKGRRSFLEEPKDRSLFGRLVSKAGFILKNGIANQLSVDQAVFQRNLQQSLKKHANLNEILEQFMSEIRTRMDNQDWLYWSLSSTVTTPDCTSARNGNQDSLMKLLLGIECLQVPLSNLLLEKLAEYTNDDPVVFEQNCRINFPHLIMAQFHWLDRIVDSQNLCNKILEILSVASEEAQKEIILCIPEIIEDKNHPEIASALMELLNEKQELTVCILDSMTNLNVSSKHLADIRITALKTVSSVDLEYLPVVVKFILQNLDSQDIDEVISELRVNLDLSSTLIPEFSSTPIEQANEKSSLQNYETLTLEAIKSAIHFNKAVGDVWLKVIDNITLASEHKVLDIFILLMLHSFDNRRKTVENLIKNKIRSNIFTDVLIQIALHAHAVGLREYFPSLQSLAENLICSSESPIRDFGASIYKNTFLAFDAYCKQEVIIALVTHIGSKQMTEIDVALDILSDLVINYSSKIAPYAVFIKGILDYLDSLSLAQVRKMYVLITALVYCGQQQEGLLLQDDLHITIRKQLSNHVTRCKRMGVVGALMAVKNLTTTRNNTDIEDDTRVSSNFRQAVSLLELIFSCVSNTPDALALFYDELSAIIQTEKVNSKLQEWVSESVISDFQDDFIIDLETESLPNVDSMPAELTLGLDSEIYNEGIALNLLPLVMVAEQHKKALQLPSGKKKKVTPITLPSHFRLVRICEAKQNNGNLESIDALLGCAIYLFSSSHLEKFDSLSETERNIICSSLFSCINWFIEIVNAFALVDDSDMKIKVIKRLENIVSFKLSLEKCLKAHPHFTPPIADFTSENLSFTPLVSSGKKGRTKKPKGKPKASRKKKGTKDNVTALTQTQLNITATQTSTAPMNKSTRDDDEPQSNTKDSQQTEINMKIYQGFFRELDLDVFCLLQQRMAANTVPSLSQCPTGLCLKPDVVNFLIEDLNRKLKFALVSGSNQQRSFWLKSKNTNNCGFSNLMTLTASDVAAKVVPLVPSICSHLEKINAFFQTLIEEQDGIIDGLVMRSEESSQLIKCLQGFLQALNLIFSWNGFSQNENRNLLKTATVYLSSRLRSGCTQLTLQDSYSQAFQYIENFSGFIPNLNCAIYLVQLLETLSIREDSNATKEKLANIADKFLQREWLDQAGVREKGADYNANIQQLLNVVLRYSQDSLQKLEHFVTVVLPDLIEAEERMAVSETYQTLDRNSFPVYYRIFMTHLIALPKMQNSYSQIPQQELIFWTRLVKVFQVLVNSIKVFDNRVNIVTCLKYGKAFVEMFLKQCMPLLDKQFRTHRDDVQSLMKTFQLSTRFLQHISNHSKVQKATALMKYVPPLRKLLETLVYRVKAMLVLNKCKEAFWLGNLKNRNLQGEEILSQSVQSETSIEAEPEPDNDIPQIPPELQNNNSSDSELSISESENEAAGNDSNGEMSEDY